MLDRNKLDTKLIQAAFTGDLKTVMDCVKKGAKIDCVDDKTGMTPLMYAITQGKMNTARYLLDKGADVNHQSPDGRSALMLAARCHGHIPLVKKLLELGADMYAKDKQEFTVLSHAKIGGKKEIIQMVESEIKTQQKIDERKKEIELCFLGGTKTKLLFTSSFPFLKQVQELQRSIHPTMIKALVGVITSYLTDDPEPTIKSLIRK